jgi:hypothetical protein
MRFDEIHSIKTTPPDLELQVWAVGIDHVVFIFDEEDKAVAWYQRCLQAAMRAGGDHLGNPRRPKLWKMT